MSCKLAMWHIYLISIASAHLWVNITNMQKTGLHFKQVLSEKNAFFLNDN